MNDSCPCHYTLCFPKCSKQKDIGVRKVILCWLQDKRVVHITSGVLDLELSKETEMSLRNTHLDHCPQWLLEGITAQVEFNYVPQVKKIYFFPVIGHAL